MLRYIAAGCTVLTLAFAGCTRGNKPEPQEETPAIVLLQQDVRNAVDANDIDTAISLLDKAMTDEKFAADRADIFSTMLSIKLNSDRTQEAVEQYITMASESVEVAEYSFGMIVSSLQASPDPSLLINFAERLLDTPFSDGTKASLNTAYVCALIANNRTDDALNLVTRLKDSSMHLDVYRGIFASLVSAGHKAGAAMVIDRIASLAADDKQLLEFVTISRLELLALNGAWSDYLSLLKKDIASLTEQGAYSVFQSAIRKIDHAANADDLKSICWTVIESRGAGEQCVIAAANQCLKLAADGDPAVIPETARKLVSRGIPANRLVNFIQKPFYTVLGSENPEKLKEMVAIVNELCQALTEEEDKTLGCSMLLDGSFILNDYDTAIAMIEKGVPGRDESWHTSALAKVKAHKALDAGNTDEAVKYFREFMKVIEATMTRETDPSSGLTYTAQWCLGRNAKRIGDLMQQAGRNEPAAEAYKEAKAYFEKALTEFPEASGEREAISKEMSAVPQAI